MKSATIQVTLLRLSCLGLAVARQTPRAIGARVTERPSTSSAAIPRVSAVPRRRRHGGRAPPAAPARTRPRRTRDSPSLGASSASPARRHGGRAPPARRHGGRACVGRGGPGLLGAAERRRAAGQPGAARGAAARAAPAQVHLRAAPVRGGPALRHRAHAHGDRVEPARVARARRAARRRGGRLLQGARLPQRVPHQRLHPLCVGHLGGALLLHRAPDALRGPRGRRPGRLRARVHLGRVRPRLRGAAPGLARDPRRAVARQRHRGRAGGALLTLLERRRVQERVRGGVQRLLLRGAGPHRHRGLLQRVQGGAHRSAAAGPAALVDQRRAPALRVAQQPDDHRERRRGQRRVGERRRRRPARQDLARAGLRRRQGGRHAGDPRGAVRGVLAAALRLPPARGDERAAGRHRVGGDAGHVARLLLLLHQPVLLRVAQPADPRGAQEAGAVPLRRPLAQGRAAGTVQPRLGGGELLPVPAAHRLPRGGRGGARAARRVRHVHAQAGLGPHRRPRVPHPRADPRGVVRIQRAHVLQLRAGPVAAAVPPPPPRHGLGDVGPSPATFFAKSA
ncbi:uncharacterized protein LOC144934855 isoform X3 [Lampetra fluviatilis]